MPVEEEATSLYQRRMLYFPIEQEYPELLAECLLVNLPIVYKLDELESIEGISLTVESCHARIQECSSYFEEANYPLMSDIIQMSNWLTICSLKQDNLLDFRD